MVKLLIWVEVLELMMSYGWCLCSQLSYVHSSLGPSIFKGSLRSTAGRSLSEDGSLEQSPVEEEEKGGSRTELERVYFPHGKV